MTRVLSSMIVLAALTAAPAVAQRSPAMRSSMAKPNANPGTPATTARNYLADASSSDMYERQSSEMILRNPAAPPQVRDFARMMISDHGRTSADLMAAAQAQGMHVPPNMKPQQMGMLNALRVHSGMDQVKLYVQQQIQAHQMALATHQSYAEHGDNAALRQVAMTAVPIVQGHLDRIQQINSMMMSMR